MVHMSSVFWWLNPIRLYSLYKNTIPNRRIESYSILGTIVLFTDLSQSMKRSTGTLASPIVDVK